MNPDIIKMAKSMKREFVEITNNYIMSTDVNRGTFSIIYLSEENPDYYIGTLAELEGKKRPDYWIPEEMLKQRLDYLRNMTFYHSSVNNHPPIYTSDNLKDDDNFSNIISRKASEGADLYKMNKEHMLYTFSSLHPLNKADVISCSIYPIENDYKSYMAEFVIDKKKWVIHEYIRYLYL